MPDFALGLFSYDVLENSSIDLKRLNQCVVQSSIGFCLASPVCVFDVPVPFDGGVGYGRQWREWYRSGQETLRLACRRAMSIQRHAGIPRLCNVVVSPSGQLAREGGVGWAMWARNKCLHAVWSDEDQVRSRGRTFETNLWFIISAMRPVNAKHSCLALFKLPNSAVLQGTGTGISTRTFQVSTREEKKDGEPKVNVVLTRCSDS